MLDEEAAAHNPLLGQTLKREHVQSKKRYNFTAREEPQHKAKAFVYRGSFFAFCSLFLSLYFILVISAQVCESTSCSSRQNMLDLKRLTQQHLKTFPLLMNFLHLWQTEKHFPHKKSSINLDICPSQDIFVSKCYGKFNALLKRETTCLRRTNTTKFAGRKFILHNNSSSLLIVVPLRSELLPGHNTIFVAEVRKVV